jgi:FkbH-like protein
MTVKIISDVVLEPVLKELTKLGFNGNIQTYYQEDIISFLLNFDEKDFSKNIILYIHSDQYFHKKPVEWQVSYLSAVNALVSRIKNKVLFSNSLSLSFSSKAFKNSLGHLFDTALSYDDLISNYLKHSNGFIFDFNNLCFQAGMRNVYQYALGHLYQMPYTKPFITLFAQTIFNQVKWLEAEEKKAIVVDCDNTLWKGVVGEDGLEGIECDNNSEGILYYHFQLFLKAKKKEGFLLCLCSKNNAQDVKEVFEKMSMPLKWKDFVIKEINWDDKWVNINKIIRKLNIGIDSIIYIDDNLFEVSSVAELAKGVSAIEFKNDYASFLNLTDSFLFKRKQILQEDIEKSTQYETEFHRKDEEKKFQNIEEFIKSLDVTLDFRLNDVGDLARLSQMTAKTNQFNFNKNPFTEDELREFILNRNRIYSLRASDKFGNYGTVGLVLVRIEEGGGVVENFLMSCRALGKRIEFDFFKRVFENLEKDSIYIKAIKFKETLKNKPAQEFVKTIDQNLIIPVSYAN